MLLFFFYFSVLVCVFVGLDMSSDFICRSNFLSLEDSIPSITQREENKQASSYPLHIRELLG